MALKIEAAPEWLLANTYSGMLYNGNSVAIRLTFKAEDFPMGNYSMDMVITSNSPTTPTITVPIQMQIAIPVELNSFVGRSERDGVRLEWQTVTETNNDGFEIQRRVDGREWEAIGFVKGKGTITEIQSYEYRDKNLRSGKYSYRLKQIDYDGSFSYSKEIEVEVELPREYSISQNYPNPFNPVTMIEYSIPERGSVRIEIYSSLGELVKVLVDEVKEAGYYSVSLDASQLPSGTYIYQMIAKGSEKSFVQSKKMSLIK
jgi:hypothetical protein